MANYERRKYERALKNFQDAAREFEEVAAEPIEDLEEYEKIGEEMEYLRDALRTIALNEEEMTAKQLQEYAAETLKQEAGPK